MEFDVFSRAEQHTVMRVLRSALRLSGRLEKRECEFLAAYALITCAPVGPDELLPLSEAEVRDLAIEGERPRRRLVQLAAIAVLFNRPVRAASFSFLRSLARHLKVHDGVLDVIHDLVRGRLWRMRMRVVRRGAGSLLADAHRREGVAGVLRFVAAIGFGVGVNRERLPDYKRLGLLPEGTLGREYWKHMTMLGFGFPGEPRGIAESVAYHDVSHVLTGHDTTPLGEIQQGCFQGGNRRRDGFAFIQFAILHFHQGIQITPSAPPTVGQFDPVKVLWAIYRGAQCPVDMTDRWDYWPLMALPLQEARARCGLLPPRIHWTGAPPPGPVTLAPGDAAPLKPSSDDLKVAAAEFR